MRHSTLEKWINQAKVFEKHKNLIRFFISEGKGKDIFIEDTKCIFIEDTNFAKKNFACKNWNTNWFLATVYEH